MILCVVVCAFVSTCATREVSAAAAREPGEPIRLTWSEGDVAGFTSIFGPDGGGAIGFVEYHQHRKGDVLETRRVARFADGSSDEDQATARVGERLSALRGRSIIRDPHGEVLVDLTIDVEGRRLSGFYRSSSSGAPTNFDQSADLSAGTYWGPLVFLVVKNFAANATDGTVRFLTVAPTPAPRLLTMELRNTGDDVMRRPGGELKLQRYALRPTINWLVDPIVHALAPSTEFLLEPGTPPALAGYDGPRNYGGQGIRLE
jgi:hypothetical protein